MVDDFWFRSVTELGRTGPDGGKGGKFLLVPGYRGDVATEGYFVVRATMNNHNIPKCSQLMRIAFASQNRLDDGLAAHPTHIAQHIGQLDIHVSQSFLYPLNMSARSSHQVVALSPIGPHSADFLHGTKRIS